MKRAVAALVSALIIVTARGACPQLRAINRSECPEDLDLDLDPCNAPGLGYGDFCEGDGECGTLHDLNNCLTADVYQIVNGTRRPTPRPTLAAGDCPDLEALRSAARRTKGRSRRSQALSQTSTAISPALFRRATRKCPISQPPKRYTKRTSSFDEL